MLLFQKISTFGKILLEPELKMLPHCALVGSSFLVLNGALPFIMAGRKPQPIIDGKKLCTKCRESKPIKQFNTDRRNKSGYRSWCKKCLHELNNKDEEKRKNWNKSYYENYQNESFLEFGVTRTRELWLLKKYNLPLEQYISMIKSQDSKCCICNKPFDFTNRNQKHICVDHCHTSGEIRGILCTCCNRGLGGFKDNLQYLEEAIVYLKKTTNMEHFAKSF